MYYECQSPNLEHCRAQLCQNNVNYGHQYVWYGRKLSSVLGRILLRPLTSLRLPGYGRDGLHRGRFQILGFDRQLLPIVVFTDIIAA